MVIVYFSAFKYETPMELQAFLGIGTTVKVFPIAKN
jgi:hypothetical protein